MSFVKKFAVLAVLAVAVSFFIPAVSFAADTLGYVNAQAVMTRHPRYAQVQKQLNAFSDKKRKEAEAAIAKTKDNKKQQQIYQSKRLEVVSEESKLMTPLFKDIDNAIHSAASANKITVVVNKSAVFYGGKDLTQDVVSRLKK